MIELNTAIQFEWIKSFFLRILRIILRSFSFNFLLFSSDFMNWCKPLQTKRHLKRLLTSNLIRMFSVMRFNPWLLKISSNILDFFLVLLEMKSIGKWLMWGTLTWYPCSKGPSAPTLRLGLHTHTLVQVRALTLTRAHPLCIWVRKPTHVCGCLHFCSLELVVCTEC